MHFCIRPDLMAYEEPFIKSEVKSLLHFPLKLLMQYSSLVLHISCRC